MNVPHREIIQSILQFAVAFDVTQKISSQIKKTPKRRLRCFFNLLKLS